MYTRHKPKDFAVPSCPSKPWRRRTCGTPQFRAHLPTATAAKDHKRAQDGKSSLRSLRSFAAILLWPKPLISHFSQIVFFQKSVARPARSLSDESGGEFGGEISGEFGGESPVKTFPTNHFHSEQRSERHPRIPPTAPEQKPIRTERTPSSRSNPVPRPLRDNLRNLPTTFALGLLDSLVICSLSFR